MARVKVEVPVEQPQHKQQTVHASETNEGNPQHPSGKSMSLKSILLVLGALLLVIFIFDLQNDRHRLQTELKSTGNTQNTHDVVQQIAQFVELPSDETPQMRTIEDASKFKEGSDVLKEINDGDIWIFYPKAGKQVFYRPETKKVIFVVPLTPSGNTSQNSDQ